MTETQQKIEAVKEAKEKVKNEINNLENNIASIVEKIPNISPFRLFFKKQPLNTMRQLKYALKQKYEELDGIIKALEQLHEKLIYEISQTIYITVGVIGSGKSSWAKKKLDENKTKEIKTVIINRDKLREMIYGKYDYAEDTEELVRQMAWDTTKRSLMSGYDVIIDECNISVVKRKQWIDFIRLHFGGAIKIVYVVCTERERNLRFRTQGGLRDIPESRWKNLIDFMIRDFQPITGNEGQDEVIEYTIPKIELG